MKIEYIEKIEKKVWKYDNEEDRSTIPNASQ